MPLSHTVQSIHAYQCDHFPIGLQWNADYEILTRITLHASMTYGRDWSRKYMTQLLYPSPADYAYARHHHLGVKDTSCDISVGYSSVAATTVLSML